MAVQSTSQNRPDLTKRPMASTTSTTTTAAPPSSNLSGSTGTSKPAALAEEAPDDAMQSAKQAGERLIDSATSAADDLSRTGKDLLSEQKAKAANQLSAFSDAIHCAADKLREDGNGATAHYAKLAADQLEGAARHLGDRDLRSLIGDVERFARRRPELFLGGMFLAGLGISRFLKSSQPDDRERLDRSYGERTPIHRP